MATPRCLIWLLFAFVAPPVECRSRFINRRVLSQCDSTLKRRMNDVMKTWRRWRPSQPRAADLFMCGHDCVRLPSPTLRSTALPQGPGIDTDRRVRGRGHGALMNPCPWCPCPWLMTIDVAVYTVWHSVSLTLSVALAQENPGQWIDWLIDWMIELIDWLI